MEPDTPATSLEKEEITPTQKKEENPSTETNYDDDVDLSEIASNLIDQTFAMDDPEFDIPDSSNEAYKSIMSLCGSTTSNIKKSIYDILNSRENTDGKEEDTTTELQESLNKKMEDFKKVISGCLDGDASAAQASTSSEEDKTVQSGVIIEEVVENVEDKDIQTGVVIEEVAESCEDQQQADSGKSPISEKASEGVVKEVPNSGSSNLKDKEGVAPKNKSNKAAKDKAKNVGLNNVNADSVATKADDTAGKNISKSSKTSEKKSDPLNLSSINSTKSLFQALSEVSV